MMLWNHTLEVDIDGILSVPDVNSGSRRTGMAFIKQIPVQVKATVTVINLSLLI